MEGILDRLKGKEEKMKEEKKITTLIGIKLAKEGEEFIFLGEAKKCESCKLRNSCMNLQLGRRYRIEKVKKDTKHECFIHEDGVYVVEVEEAPITAAIGARKAFEGSKIVFEMPECDKIPCELRDFCFPLGLKKGDKCTILKVMDMPGDCKKGYSLKLVEVKRSF